MHAAAFTASHKVFHLIMSSPVYVLLCVPSFHFTDISCDVFICGQIMQHLSGCQQIAGMNSVRKAACIRDDSAPGRFVLIALHRDLLIMVRKVMKSPNTLQFTEFLH